MTAPLASLFPTTSPGCARRCICQQPWLFKLPANGHDHYVLRAGLILAFGILQGMALWSVAEDRDPDFEHQIYPMLQSRCITCHGPEKQKGGLRLDTREFALKGGDTGPAIVPRNPSKSLLLQAVSHQRKDLEMPPKEKLDPKDIAMLEQWIRRGAPWNTIVPGNTSQSAIGTSPTVAPGSRQLGNAWSDPENPIRRLFHGDRLDLWSLQPIRSPFATNSPPAVAPTRGMDLLLMAARTSAGLPPSPEADRRTLLRRLSFDLIGLPPTYEEVVSFEQDHRPDAYERVVDRLLNSPQYGEHAARLWLDIVRYSDSNGFDWDEFRPRAWRFRDYVIRSFNQDKPFDRFITEQLAGDELLSGAPASEADQDCWIATGYLRLGPHDNTAATFNEQDRSRAELLADLTETTASAFLGLSMNCCRCHDHKFDPLSQADHFRLRAFFEPVRFADDTPIDLRSDQEALTAHNTALDAKIAELTKESNVLLESVKCPEREKRLAALSAEEKHLVASKSTDLSPDSKARLEAIQKKLEPSDKEARKSLQGETQERFAQLEGSIRFYQSQKRSPTFAMLMTDSQSNIPPTRILFQGDPKAPRDSVSPGFISALDPNPARILPPINPNTQGRRLTLARWITSPTNPFTARVWVNRIWQSHFGEGLVATPNDFGKAGTQPSQPELLDWLASEFLRQGQSTKALHRWIVTSAAYRENLAKPNSTPGNQTGSIPSPRLRRLSAEQLRDALLSVSGALHPKSGGPPVWPDLPADILQANPAFLDDNAEKTKGWYPSPASEQTVRSIYLVQKRTVRVPFLETFDLPENATSCARRNVSIVAPQALTLLNGTLAKTLAQRFAERVHAECGDKKEPLITRAFQLALQRNPTPAELDTSRKFVERQGLGAFCRVLMNLNEFLFLD